MNIRSILLCFLVAAGLLRADESPGVKWHPGHYIFIGKSELTEELLTLPHFPGVQKVYTWRDFESAKSIYDFSTLKADLALAKKHGRQLVVQFSYKKFFVKSPPIRSIHLFHQTTLLNPALNKCKNILL